MVAADRHVAPRLDTARRGATLGFLRSHVTGHVGGLQSVRGVADFGYGFDDGGTIAKRQSGEMALQALATKIEDHAHHLDWEICDAREKR